MQREFRNDTAAKMLQTNKCYRLNATLCTYLMVCRVKQYKFKIKIKCKTKKFTISDICMTR